MHIPSFTTAFLSPTFERRSPSPPRQPAHGPVLFSRSRHVSEADFLGSVEFDQCQQEYAGLMDGFARFVQERAKELDPPWTDELVARAKRQFFQLRDKLANRNSFSGEMEDMYGTVKQMFHKLESLLADERIPLQRRMNEIHDMIDYLDRCPGGIGSAAMGAVANLRCSNAGIKGAAYLVKRNMVENLITGHVKRTHPPLGGNEMHFVNDYFNDVAPLLGMPIRKDPSLPRPGQISDEQRKTCKDFVLSRLKPSVVANKLAGSFLDRIDAATRDKGIDITKPLLHEQLTTAREVTGVLKEAELNDEFGLVPEQTYLIETHSGGEIAYNHQPSLLTVHFMDRLKETGVVNYDKAVTLFKGEPRNDEWDIMQLDDLFWLESDGARNALTAGDLLRTAPQMIVGQLNAQGVVPAEQGMIFERIARRVRAGTQEPKEIPEVPPEWLHALASLYKEQPSWAEEWVKPVVLMAVDGDHADILQTLRDEGADVAFSDPHGTTTMMFAAGRGHTDCVKVIMGEDLVAGASGTAATGVAASAGSDPCAGRPRATLRVETQVGRGNKNGWTAFMFAAHAGNVDVMQFLQKKGADIHARNSGRGTALLHAAEQGHEGPVRMLLRLGADANVRDIYERTSLMLAAGKGDHAMLETLITAGGAEIDATDNAGATALLYAAANGSAAALRILIGRGAEINHRRTDGKAALHLAARAGKIEAIEMLIEKRANVDILDASGATPLYIAADGGQTGAAHALLAAEADSETRVAGLTPLLAAVRGGHTETVGMLARRAKLTAADADGNTAVHWAVFPRKAELIQVLHESAANLNATNQDGATAVKLAVQANCPAVLRALIDAGAAVDIPDHHGCTALMDAAKDGVIEILKMLIAAKAEGTEAPGRAAANDNRNALRSLLDATDALGQTALILAAVHGHDAALKILLDAGAKVDAVNNDGFTALMEAAELGHPEAVRILLDAGADVLAGTDDDQTPAMLVEEKVKKDVNAILLPLKACAAAERGNTAALESALDRGAAPGTSNPDGETVLMLAARNGHLDALKLLIKRGAGVDETDKQGNTALILAAANGHPNSLRYLADAGGQVNKKNKQDDSAVILAARNGHPNVVRALNKAGANINMADGNGDTAAAIAVRNHQHDVILALAEAGVDTGATSTMRSGKKWRPAAKEPGR